jgi:hypothetical protein
MKRKTFMIIWAMSASITFVMFMALVITNQYGVEFSPVFKNIYIFVMGSVAFIADAQFCMQLFNKKYRI